MQIIENEMMLSSSFLYINSSKRTGIKIKGNKMISLITSINNQKKVLGMLFFNNISVILRFGDKDCALVADYVLDFFDDELV